MTDRRHNMIKQVLAQILIHINKCRKRSPERESSRTFTCRTVEWCFLKRTVGLLCLHCVSKNAQTLPGCSFDNRGLILISFDKQHDQHTFKNDMHFQVSLSLQFYLLYLLLNICDGNDTFWRHSVLVKQSSSFSRKHWTSSSHHQCCCLRVFFWKTLFSM